MAVTYYITARKQLTCPDAGDNVTSLKQKIRNAFSAGIDYVQVREKDLPARLLALLMEELSASPEKRHSRLLVNERWDIAASCGADGVHLRSDSLPVSVLRSQAGEKMIVGVSCHNEQDVSEAVRQGASYALLGPVFETPSKPGAKPLGLNALAEICRRFSIPIYALGGITAENAEQCVRAGAAGVAGIRLFQQAPDLERLRHHLRSL